MCRMNAVGGGEAWNWTVKPGPRGPYKKQAADAAIGEQVPASGLAAQAASPCRLSPPRLASICSPSQQTSGGVPSRFWDRSQTQDTPWRSLGIRPLATRLPSQFRENATLDGVARL